MSKPVDLRGKKFNKLTAVAPLGRRGHNGMLWMCVCECGREIEVAAYDLKSGRVRSCGCSNHAPQDYTGVRRGNLIGIRRTGKTVNHYGRECEVWEWRCDCGERLERALFQVAPNGTSCCDKCMTARRSEQQKRFLRENRVLGTSITKGQLQSLLEGRVSARNSSGVRGVSWSKNANKWVAMGTVNKKQKHLGYFTNIEDAIRAREDFIRKNYPSLGNH